MRIFTSTGKNKTETSRTVTYFNFEDLDLMRIISSIKGGISKNNDPHNVTENTQSPCTEKSGKGITTAINPK